MMHVSKRKHDVCNMNTLRSVIIKQQSLVVSMMKPDAEYFDDDAAYLQSACDVLHVMIALADERELDADVTLADVVAACDDDLRLIVETLPDTCVLSS